MRHFLITFIFLLSFSLSAQIDRVVQFDAALSGGKTIITWTVGAGTTCESVVVQRSSDTAFFQDVYTYPSICGNSAVDESYAWIDEEPIPFSLNYYRLKVENVDFTWAKKVDNNSQIKKGELSIYPNPSRTNTAFWFEQKRGMIYQLVISDFMGKTIYTSNEEQTSTFELDVSALNAGVYNAFVLDEDGAVAYSSKLVIF
jgi:hypothetical protein